MEFQEYPESLDFEKYWLILKKHWFSAGIALILPILGGVAMAAIAKPTYEAQGKLLLKKQTATSALVTSSDNKLGELEALGKDDTPLDTEAEVIRSLPIAQKVVTQLGWKEKDGKPFTAEQFLKILKVKAARGTDILQLSYINEDPQKAASAVNQVINVYIQENLQANRAEAAAARQFISKQLPIAESSLREIESMLRRFKEQNRIIDLDQEAKSAVGAIADLDGQLSKTKVQLDSTATKLRKIESEMGVSPAQALSIAALSESVGVQKALEGLQQVQQQLVTQQARFHDQAPSILKLKEEQANLRGLLQERVGQVLTSQESISERNLQAGKFQQELLQNLVSLEVERLSLIAQMKSIDQVQKTYKQRAESIPGLEQRQGDLIRQRDAAQSTYQILLKSLQQVQIAENQNIGNVRVVSSAVIPERAVGSKKELMIGGGIVVGCLLYVIVAFVAELRDPSIKTTKELRKIFEYPIVGAIPYFKRRPLSKHLKASLPRLPGIDEPQLLINESYNILQSSFRLLDKDRKSATIVVTSSIAQEGKSIVSANLAYTSAQLGHRVLLIEADMRHPTQSFIWNLTNNIGLEDVLLNPAKVSQAITSVSNNLDVLASREISSSPLSLINSEMVEKVLKDFSQMYDLIIVDTPPLLLAVDALLVAKISDGILLVTRPGVIDRTSAVAAKERLEQSGRKILGCVVNGIMEMNEPQGYFHHVKRYQKKQ
jgi:capsular exopolysaccharide synthesis family protein